MKRFTAAIAATAASLALIACSSETSLPPTSITDAGFAVSADRGTGEAMKFEHAKVCPGSPFGTARCHSLVRIDPDGQPQQNAAPRGFGPADLRAAYALTGSGSGTQTIAIVDAYDDGNAESDLAVYRSTFGLPACTTANGCFRKVDQNGGTNYPRGNMGWAEEISLDLDMASAICPNCHILLVEATTNSFANLSAAVDRAALMGATVISNSYGGGEYSGAE